jgi:hypothetical protein
MSSDASLLLTALTVHGCITDDLSISTVLPIPKGKNLNYSDSSNYRGLALSSIFGKIFDAYVLTRYDSLLAASNLQFGFKAGYSTSMCSMILKETLEHYRSNKSTVYCTMLDASKAFDRVEYCKLVRLLSKKINAYHNKIITTNVFISLHAGSLERHSFQKFSRY